MDNVYTAELYKVTIEGSLSGIVVYYAVQDSSDLFAILQRSGKRISKVENVGQTNVFVSGRVLGNDSQYLDKDTPALSVLKSDWKIFTDYKLAQSISSINPVILPDRLRCLLDYGQADASDAFTYGADICGDRTISQFATGLLNGEFPFGLGDLRLTILGAVYNVS